MPDSTLPPSTPETTDVSRRARLAVAALAVMGLLGVVSHLDAAGDYPGLGAGPGLTVDEMFNVSEGFRLVEATRFWFLGELTWQQIFGQQEDLLAAAPAGYHLADHPPLGRVALGLAHQTVTALVAPTHSEATPLAPTAARFGSAIAFGWLIYLVGRTTAGWYGSVAGFSAATSLLLMPRLVAHAHLASLEMMITLAYTASVLSLAERWATGSEAPRVRQAVVPGLLLGLALLTKIQAILLIPAVVAWSLFRFRTRAIRPLLCWTAIGGVVFFVGWPWLWLDPLDHLIEYFARTTERAQLSVYYLGNKTPDTAVPWHYAPVLFGVTVPLGLHALAACGLVFRNRQWWHDHRTVLLVTCIAFPLQVFMTPGVAVYDGTRLFLVVFPLWAVLIGRGTMILSEWLSQRPGQLSRGTKWLLPAAILISSSWGLITTHPCGLSYYNIAVGGPAGAESLGFEPTYWGDSLTRNFLAEVAERVPEDETIAVFPSLHPLQWPTFTKHARVWDHTPRRLALYGTPDAAEANWVMIFRRKADLPEHLRKAPPDTKRVCEVRRAGVLLAALYHRDAPQNPSAELRKPRPDTYTEANH